MFKPGRLLYFDPFVFKNGADPKKKYFLVLHKGTDGVLLASLPTSRDHIPSDMIVRPGVYDFPERMVSVYAFMAGQEIATDPCSGARFSFPRNTFIYGEQLGAYREDIFRMQEKSGISSIQIVGDLDEEIFNEIKSFLKQSIMVRKGFQKLL